MFRILRYPLYFLVTAALLLLFVVMHELGHTVVARLAGDPEATFYLVRIDDNGACLGCNITDHTRLSPTGNLMVSLAGLATTALGGLGLMLAGLWSRWSLAARRRLRQTGLAFILLDGLVQGVQGILYDIDRHSWPTNVDLMDSMLLIQQSTGWSQPALKLGLGLLLAIYLVAAIWLYRKIGRVAAAG